MTDIKPHPAGIPPPTNTAHSTGFTSPKTSTHLKTTASEFVQKNITGFGGRAEEDRGIPLMLFERQQDAHRFAGKFSLKLNISKEHIAVKAWK